MLLFAIASFGATGACDLVRTIGKGVYSTNTRRDTGLVATVFFRDDGGGVIDGHLARLDVSVDYEVRALALNMRYDFRVSAPRATDFQARLMGPPDPGVDPLRKALIQYHKQTVRESASPSFLNGNHENLIPLGGLAAELHPRYALGTILDLTARINEAKRSGNPAFKRFRLEDQHSAALGNSFLQKEFLDRDEKARDEFLEDFFFALDKMPRHPVWVTSWERLALYLDVPRCLQAVGSPRRDAPRVLIALRYEARDVGTLVRPCQLDAGDFVYHYPSPPMRILREGGAVMDLAVPSGLADPLPEFIHCQPLFKLDYWQAAERWVEKTSGPVRVDLAETRRQHEELLRKRHGRHKPPWLAEFAI